MCESVNTDWNYTKICYTVIISSELQIFKYRRNSMNTTQEQQHTKPQKKSNASKQNNTGILLQMKRQYEKLSGFSFDDVKVHYNSDKPVQLQALAYTQGNHVFIGPGQETHLSHELGM